MHEVPYFERDSETQIVLKGELDFDITKHPAEIYKRLCHAAEEVGGMVSTSGIHHGGRITVYPRFGSEYYVLHIYEENEDPETLQVMHITTWRQVQLLDLKEKRAKALMERKTNVPP